MYRKDQIKGIVALILFACIGISYFFFQNGDVTKTISIIGIVIWLGLMYFLNRKKED
jgi:hypothetical protein